MADNAAFFHDTREPFMSADQPAVTLLTTDVGLYAASAMPVFGGQYWARVGKKGYLRVFGKMTSGTAAGNLTVSVYYGTGGAANGTVLVASAAQTWIASQTNIPWLLQVWLTCRTTGSTGTFFATGIMTVGTAAIAAGTFLLPASAPVASAGVDLTAANIISVQAKRTGSTVETMTTQDLEFCPLN